MKVLLFVVFLLRGMICLADLDSWIDIHSRDELPVSKPFSILFVGDSNTQSEYTMSWIVKMLRNRVGYVGTGYRSAVSAVAMGWGNPSEHPGLSIWYSSGWQKYDMAPGKALEVPYLSPDGNAMISDAAGAMGIMKFTGDSIDLYYLQGSAKSQRFSVKIDDGTLVEVDAGGNTQEVKKHSIGGLDSGNHKLVVTALDEGVVFLGFDVKNNTRNPRVVCHKWGNGSAHTGHYLNIDERIFAETLRLLAPDLVIIILGTNDHNLGHFSKEIFPENLAELVRRIKAGIPSAQTMLVSTFRTNTLEGQPGGLLDGYRAYSYARAAKESDSSYWDMSSEFEEKYGVWPGCEKTINGPYKGTPTYTYPPYIMRDAVHVSLDGAEFIAEGLWGHIVSQYGDLFLEK